MRPRPIDLVLVIVMAGVALQPAAAAAPSNGAASLHDRMDPPVLPEGGRYEPLGKALRIQGQQVSAWAFDAPGSVPELADWLSRRQSALRDLWVTPYGVVLAGMDADVQWAARLFEAGNGRTRGTVSALSLRTNAMADGPRDRAATAAWRLRGGKLLFELQSRDTGEIVLEQVWSHASAPPDLHKSLQRELNAEGWTRGVHAHAPVVQQWVRGRARLSAHIVPLDGGSGVTVVLRLAE